MRNSIEIGQMVEVPLRGELVFEDRTYWPLASFSVIENHYLDEYDLVWDRETSNYLLLLRACGTEEYILDCVVPSIVADCMI